ncbi:MAG: cyclase family protein [Saprospiraceae bacterium]
MVINLKHQSKNYAIDLSQPLDISIPLQSGFDNPNCFYAPAPEFEPVRSGDWVGATAEGGIVNFKNVRFNPHGNGTHTECVGHIAKTWYSIQGCLDKYHFIAKLITVYPEMKENGDRVIEKHQLEELIQIGEVEAIVIRTMPNDDFKQCTNYSHANPPYIHHEAMRYLVDCGIEHFLIDLPSVDREHDEGKLLAHRAFWQYPENVRENATITELIYVPNYIKDGKYFLNIQIATFDLDASPSKPQLYALTEIS